MKTTAARLFVAVVIGTAVVEFAYAQPPMVVSKSVVTNTTGGGNSLFPVLTSDGCRLVFLSHANNLVTNDDSQQFLDVFVHDSDTGMTTLVSVDSSGSGGGDGDSNYPNISSNGQFVVFASEAENLIENDTNRYSDIFVRDLINGTTRFVARRSSWPVATPDGRYVAYETLPSRSPPGQGPTLPTKFVLVRDLQATNSEHMSVRSDGSYHGEGESVSPAISHDGNRVAFVSTVHPPLVSAPISHSYGNIYVRDRQASNTIWVSTNVARLVGDNSYRCSKPAISADGRFVAFKAARVFSPGPVYVFYHAVNEGQTTLLSSNGFGETWPAMSSEGRYVAFEQGDEIVLWDSYANTFVSVTAPEETANGVCHTPVLTPDGRKIAFLCAPTNQTGKTQLYVRDLELGVTRLVSRTPDGEPSNAGLEEIQPSLSADGTIVAFDSPADDLVPNDVNQASDVFVFDVETSTTRLISARHSLLGSQTALRHSTLPGYAAALSANGETLVFTSLDGNFTPANPNRQMDVLAANLRTGHISPVSHSTAQPSSQTNYIGYRPLINADARYVLFYLRQMEGFSSVYGNTAQWLFRRDLLNEVTEQVHTESTSVWLRDVPAISADGNLVAYPIGGVRSQNLFLRDMSSGSNQLIASTFQRGFFPLFSPDSRWLVFESSDVITTNSGSAEINLYARDLRSNITMLISANSNWARLPGRSTGAVFVASGRHLLFQQWDRSAPWWPPSTYLFDFETRQPPQFICTNCFGTRSTPDLRLLTFGRWRSRFSADLIDIWEKNLENGVEFAVTSNRTATALANRSSAAPSISSDGRFVVFQSTADDLVANDRNRVADLFVRDRVLNVTMLISRNRDGTASGNGVASRHIMAADGRTMIFHSNADDLTEGDYNNAYDVFVLRLGVGDSDNDGLDDGWEVAHFGDLSRDGRGDQDDDGRTDATEFLAGTDPTNAGSVLTVLAINGVGSKRTTLIWSAVPGRHYQPQFKSSLKDLAWTDLPGTVTASDSTASYVDASAAIASTRFYRVVLVQ